MNNIMTPVQFREQVLRPFVTAYGGSYYAAKKLGVARSTLKNVLCCQRRGDRLAKNKFGIVLIDDEPEQWRNLSYCMNCKRKTRYIRVTMDYLPRPARQCN